MKEIIINKATVRKSNEQYDVLDTDYDNLTISATILNPFKNTTGHKHQNDEFYFVVSGTGLIEIDTIIKHIETGDTITIKPNQFHRLHNNTDKPLIVICAWPRFT